MYANEMCKPTHNTPSQRDVSEAEHIIPQSEGCVGRSTQNM